VIGQSRLSFSENDWEFLDGKLFLIFLKIKIYNNNIFLTLKKYF